MIKMLTAFTVEIDDREAAVSEILSQLDVENHLLKNTIGILHCYAEFLDSGVVKELCRRLPFDVVGGTTLSGSVNGKMDEMALTLTVLTSDDVCFTAGVSSSLFETDMSLAVSELYKRLAESFPQKPSMLMPFFPFLSQINSDDVVAKLNELYPNVPAFGMISVTGDPDYSGVCTIYNGEAYTASLALILISGAVDPRFYSISIQENIVLNRKIIITGVEKNILRSINNVPAVRYFESIGIVEEGDVNGLIAMSLEVHAEDGSRMTRAIVGTTTEDGGIVLAGSVPINASISFSLLEKEEVLTTTEQKIREVAEIIRNDKDGKNRCCLMYSCVGRNWALGTENMEEHKRAVSVIGDSFPYQFIYSGGEIFPSKLNDGRIVNLLQNYTLIICIL
jgi:hypothetical protein